MSVEQYLADYAVRIGLAPEIDPFGAPRQILVVHAVLPHIGAWQNSAKPAEYGAYVVLQGRPTPSSDPHMATALVRFTAGPTRAPVYVPSRHQIELDMPYSGLGPFLQVVQHATEVYCWIGFFPGQTYGDVHCRQAGPPPTELPA